MKKSLFIYLPVFFLLTLQIYLFGLLPFPFELLPPINKLFSLKQKVLSANVLCTTNKLQFKKNSG